MTDANTRAVRKTRDIVSLFGGPSALARELGEIKQAAITNWATQGGVPGKWHLRLLSMAESRGIELTPTDLLETRNRK